MLQMLITKNGMRVANALGWEKWELEWMKTIKI